MRCFLSLSREKLRGSTVITKCFECDVQQNSYTMPQSLAAAEKRQKQLVTSKKLKLLKNLEQQCVTFYLKMTALKIILLVQGL